MQIDMAQCIPCFGNELILVRTTNPVNYRLIQSLPSFSTHLVSRLEATNRTRRMQRFPIFLRFDPLVSIITMVILTRNSFNHCVPLLST